jgi:hypothetical protein
MGAKLGPAEKTLGGPIPTESGRINGGYTIAPWPYTATYRTLLPLSLLYRPLVSLRRLIGLRHQRSRSLNSPSN